MSSGHSLKHKPLSYLDAVRVFNELEADLKDASRNSAHSAIQLLQAFNSISTRLHTLDMQVIMPPMKPQWKLMRKEYTELIWQVRTNALTISARLKMFGAVVLPLAMRPANGQSSRSHHETLHVLQSYMSISAEQAALTFQLVEKAVNLNTALANFHTAVAKASSQRASTGQRELQQLSHKIVELQTNVKSSKLSLPDVTHVAFTALRLIASFGQQSSRAKLSRYSLTLNGNDLSQLTNLYQELDRTRNEVAHAQYASQISHRKSDILSNVRSAISDLVPNEVSSLETALNFMMAIWLRLQADCQEMLTWIQKGRNSPPPPSVATYFHGGYTIYSALSVSLDQYVEGIDPSQFPNIEINNF
ncbi:hypothetical protein C8J57DRAFT_1043674 [Mycena rebaudengoi]|nr:hypothetical protein C8J57DRAFT_1043674 [Mycena rebaudengoi]